MNKKDILALLKKHYPDFLPVDLHIKPWLKDLIVAAYEKGKEEGYTYGYNDGYEAIKSDEYDTPQW